MKDEDIAALGYQYHWSKEFSTISLTDYLAKYKPSMVQNDGTKPWIWVERAAPEKEDTGKDKALEEGAALLKKVTAEVEAIKNDPSIPLRSSKKTGAKSKKEVREQKQAEAAEKLKEISIKHGFVSGKWLIFAGADKVDMIWSHLANSLVSGPLSSTPAHLAKVATSPMDDNPNYQHVMCLYMPNVYDKDAVTEVMKVLLRNHGLTLSGVKSNLYTALGIDSKHPSGIPSTIWKNTALMKDTEIKELKEQFYKELSAKPAASAPAGDAAAVAKPSSAAADAPAAKLKPKLKKKKQNDNPFASDDDADAGEPKPKKEAPSKKATSKKRAKDSGEDESEDEPPKKKKLTRK